MMKRLVLFFAVALLFAACNNAERQYQKALDLLDVSRPLELQHILDARDAIACADKFSPEQVAQLQESFVHYLLACADMQSSLMEENYGTALSQISARQSNAEVDSLQRAMKNFAEFGISMYLSEGGIETHIMPMFVAKTFWNYLSESEKRVIELAQLEQDSPVLLDAALNVTYEEVARRLKLCDDLLTDFPNDQLISQMTACRDYYLFVLMIGDDNAPVFDWRTQQLLPDIQQIMEIYIDEYSDAVSAPILSEFLEILKKTDYKKSDEIDDFILKFFYQTQYF